MADKIRFRLPILGGMVADDWTPLEFIGQDTKVFGQRAVITDAVLMRDSDGTYLDIEAEVLQIVRELHGPMTAYSYGPEPPPPPRRPQGTFATAAEALAYAESLPPRYHVLDDHGETVPCDHPACDHCRGRETPWHYSSVCRVEGHDFPTVPRDGEGTDTCTRCGVEVTRGGGREVYRYPGGDG